MTPPVGRNYFSNSVYLAYVGEVTGVLHIDAIPASSEADIVDIN